MTNFQTFQTLAHDVFDKEQAVFKKEQELFLAKVALLEAKAALAIALRGPDGPTYDQVAIDLGGDVAICTWDGEAEYDVKFIGKVS